MSVDREDNGGPPKRLRLNSPVPSGSGGESSFRPFHVTEEVGDEMVPDSTGSPPSLGEPTKRKRFRYVQLISANNI